MTKTSSNVYEVQKNHQTIYIFHLNKNHFVTEVEYPAYDIQIHIEDIQNDTTRRNRKFLENFLKTNNIKLIKE